MSTGFVTWFSLMQISLFPSMSAKLGHVCLLGLCSWGWWQKSTDGWRLALGLWSLKWWLGVSSMTWWCFMGYLAPVWWGLFSAWLLQRMLCHTALCSSFHLRLENLSVNGKSRKQWRAYSTILLENTAALLGPSVEETCLWKDEKSSGTHPDEFSSGTALFLGISWFPGYEMAWVLCAELSSRWSKKQMQQTIRS